MAGVASLFDEIILMTMTARVGLCASCLQARTITSGKGATFWLCGKSKTDPRFPKYPVLPVLECSGYEPGSDKTPAQELGA
jgi:hypothetical protein